MFICRVRKSLTGPVMGIAMIFCVLLLSVCAASSTPVQVEEPTKLPLLLDTDMGSSDAMALLYLLSRADVELKVVTVAGTGEAYCEYGVRNVLGLLALAGQPDVPVACGSPKPLKGENAFPAAWRSRTNRLKGLDLPAVEAEPETSAPELLKDTIRAAPSKVVILTLGPLTNVAQALLDEPGLAGRIDRIVMMGGAVRAEGNVEPDFLAEWNFYVDPYAAQVVFEAGAPITLIPLDATNFVPATVFTLDALAAYHETWQAQAVYDMFRADSSLYDGFYYFWDPLAAAATLEPELVSLETLKAKVIQEGDEQGSTVEAQDGSEMLVALSAEGRRFEEEFIGALNGGIQVSLPEQKPDVLVSYDGRKCTYEGPETVPAGRLVVSVTNTGETDFALAIVTLQEGKGAADLLALPDSVKPPWANDLNFTSPPIGGQALGTAQVVQGPLYFVCLSPERVLDVLPTVEVEE